MRKLVLILFLAMLPLQWTAAAVASLCLPDAQTRGSAQAHASARADAAIHAHDHTPDSTSDSASQHHGDHEHDGKALHIDHGGCCHPTASALPIRLAIARMQPAPGDLVSRITVLAVSHASESPFRPPRFALA